MNQNVVGGAPTNSIFQEPWWLDAVAPGKWKEAVVRQDDQVVARMPYVVKKRYGLTSISMPQLTQTLGPCLRPTANKYEKQLGQEKRWLTELIDQLPAFDYFAQCWHHSVVNWLPFYWRGFQCEPRYTYKIDDLSDCDRIWDGFCETLRRGIRKASKKLCVRDDADLESFLALNTETYQRQGRKLPYSREFLIRLDAACASRGSRRIYLAEDAAGQPHAAVYIIWDERSAYYLMGGAASHLRDSAAKSLLLWQAIQDASRVTRCFDFEGSMIEPIERFVRRFGARQCPYFMIKGLSRRMRVLDACRHVIRRRVA